MTLLFSLLLALLLDYLLKEPKRFHPLVGFGNLAVALEKRLNQGSLRRLSGLLAWLLAVLPLTLLFYWLDSLLADSVVIELLFAGLVLYLAVGWQSLLTHALAIARPLKVGQLDEARQAVSMIVSRDTSQLDEQAIATAATESMLENGADAIFCALFWFCLFGVPGVVLYRLSNTLDAMWGYKNQRFLQFGWAAARIDDLLNFIPARLTALSYALMGQTRIALDAWRQQAGTWKSPNAGPVMAAGAGAINVSLGGAAIYHGELQQRPQLGPQNGQAATGESIEQACKLVNRVLLLWVVVIAFSTVGAVTSMTVILPAGSSL